VLLGTPEGLAAAVHLGTLNAAGTAQYARLGGAAAVYLLPRHVGGEWDVVRDMASRLPGGGNGASRPTAGLLLPVSMAQVWSVEIVRDGMMTRFERDPAGEWFRHTGQHSHAAGAAAHKADPARARVIGSALARLGETVVERRVADGSDTRRLAEFGLALPKTILLLYARDNPTPVARVELGDMAWDFDRYARLAPGGDIMTVAEFDIAHLAELLKSSGSDS
jgi:hypothetical protein